MKISKVPFVAENTKILHSNEELEAIYTNMIEQKSTLEIPEIKAEIYNKKYTLIEEYPTTNFLPVILAITEKESRTGHLLVFVEIDRGNYSVIGFDD